MQISFVIVTKNRPEELAFTLGKLKAFLDLDIHEVLIFIDGCDKTEKMISEFSWVQWEVSKYSVGASPARHILYKKAKGTILIGLDDDSHPLTQDFIMQVQKSFLENPSVAIIAFQEIKGVFLSDDKALEARESQKLYYLTNNFIGCGFAITNEAYKKTRGFAVWMDIYGEESCLSLEIIELGFDILYDNEIIVNHRVDKKKRLRQGRNHFRFEKQLKNSIFYYSVYYPKPYFKIARLLLHNFKSYALKDRTYFVLFFSAIFTASRELFKVLQYRKPVSKETLQKIHTLKRIKY